MWEIASSEGRRLVPRLRSVAEILGYSRCPAQWLPAVESVWSVYVWVLYGV